MISLIGTLLGFGGSIFPQILKMFQDKRDKEHELKLLQLQIESQRQGHIQRLEEVNVMADVEESKALYGYGKAEQSQISGNKWIDGFNAFLFSISSFLSSTVRPVITYLLIFSYLFIKIATVKSMGVTWKTMTKSWTEFDSILLSTIVSFWFGHRTMKYFFGKR